MAYTKFIPEIWAEAINRALERNCVFAEDCNRQYEGSVSKAGDTVHILGIGKVTIHTLARASASGSIQGAEEVADNSLPLVVDQIRYFNYMVGDIDKAQAVGGIMDALSKEAAEGLANEIDQYIAKFATTKHAVEGGTQEYDIPKLYSTAKKVVAGTAGTNEVNILDALDEAYEKLLENDVSTSTKVVVTVPPKFYTLLKKAYVGLATDNVGELKNGKVGRYANMEIKMSNNVAKENTNEFQILVRTQRAIAFVNPLTHTEAYRPEDKFADAVKGYTLFAGVVARPEEAVVLNCKF